MGYDQRRICAYSRVCKTYIIFVRIIYSYVLLIFLSEISSNIFTNICFINTNYCKVHKYLISLQMFSFSLILFSNLGKSNIRDSCVSFLLTNFIIAFFHKNEWIDTILTTLHINCLHHLMKKKKITISTKYKQWFVIITARKKWTHKMQINDKFKEKGSFSQLHCNLFITVDKFSRSK